MIRATTFLAGRSGLLLRSSPMAYPAVRPLPNRQTSEVIMTQTYEVIMKDPLPSQDHGVVGLPRQQGRLTGASTVHRRSSGQHTRSGLPATSLRRAHVCRRGLQLDLGRRALIHVGLLSPCEERTEPSS